jgi:hypothetical protein
MKGIMQSWFMSIDEVKYNPTLSLGRSPCFPELIYEGDFTMGEKYRPLGIILLEDNSYVEPCYLILDNHSRLRIMATSSFSITAFSPYPPPIYSMPQIGG